MKRLFAHQVVFAVTTASLLLLAPASYPAGPGRFSGTVAETMNAGEYTYVQVDTGKEKIWAASPQFSVKVGDKVSFSDGMPMENFESKTLKRTFKTVYFVSKIEGPGQSAAAQQAPHGMPNGATQADLHKTVVKKNPAAPIDFSNITKANGGLTVAELYQQMDKLEKKQVTFRGKVVKYNSQIMNKNWLHVQDGTGTAGNNDVTVTSDDTAQIGDTILVKGTVVLNKDYGFGYKYKLVVENAKIAVERPK